VLGGEQSVAFLKKEMADRAYRVRVAAAIALAQRGELGELSTTVAALGKRARRSLRLVQMFAHILPVREADVRQFAQDTGQDAFVRVAALRALAAKAAATMNCCCA
jgi:hypothetical protein